MAKWSKLGLVFVVAVTTLVLVWQGRSCAADVAELVDLDVSDVSETVDTNDEPVVSDDEDELWDSSKVNAEMLLDLKFTLLSEVKSYRKSIVLLVSTLDGALSALDADNAGDVMWRLETGPGSLLSSSISKVELNNEDGQSFRLIPSLNGGLYKFDGDSIEAIPFTADNLLKTQYRVSDEWLITGGKEVRTYGIDLRTGRLRYVCTADGCRTEPTSPSLTMSREFLIVRRHTQVVRAVEPLTGVESWNFSVGKHEASLLLTNDHSFMDCQTKNENDAKKQMDCFLRDSQDGDGVAHAADVKSAIEFKVTVPDGSVTAVNIGSPSSVLWKHKFASPIVNVWQLVDDHLVPVSLFNAETVLALDDKNVGRSSGDGSPLLYVGLHHKQLYIQESPHMAALVSQASELPISTPDMPTFQNRLQWKPLLITSLATVNPDPNSEDGMLVNGGLDDSHAQPPVSQAEIDKSTALIVRHESKYPFDLGLYLFAPSDKSNTETEGKEKADADKEKDEELPTVHFIVVGLWFWWREVVFISLLTAFLFHLVVTRQVVHMLQARWTTELQRHIALIIPAVTRLVEQRVRQVAIMDTQPSEATQLTQEEALVAVTVEAAQEPVPKIPTPVTTLEHTVPTAAPAQQQYVSRYLTDFEPVQCLGRGGFGLVFEARNQLDDCHYAVKRIQLPNSQEAREKVMREVKALAKLDNPHIVRYFHAWIECPPPGWQESRDAYWLDAETFTGPTPNQTGEADSSHSRAANTGLLHSHSSAENVPIPFGYLRSGHVIKSLRLTSIRSQSSNDSFDVVFENSENPDQDRPDPDSRHPQSNSLKCLSISQDSHSSSDFDSSACSESGFSVDPVGDPAPVPVKVFPVQEAKMFLYIQMQLCRKESLREWLRVHVVHRDPFQILHKFNEIVKAVEYVHLQGLIHRDLKPSNIFFAPDGAIKIGDFGLVTAMTEDSQVQSPSHDSGNGAYPFHKHTDQVGTQLYMSPEQIEAKPYNHKVDIYSLGLIFVELLWPLSTQMEQVTVISQLRKLKFPQGFIEKYPQEENLLRKMLSRNPDERLTTFGIRASPPLVSHQDPSILDIPEYLHYNLQRPRSTTRTSSSSSL